MGARGQVREIDDAFEYSRWRRSDLDAAHPPIAHPHPLVLRRAVQWKSKGGWFPLPLFAEFLIFFLACRHHANRKRGQEAPRVADHDPTYHRSAATTLPH